MRAASLAIVAALITVRPSDGEAVPSAGAHVTFGAEATVQGAHGSWAFWGLGQTYAPDANYPSTHHWLLPTAIAAALFLPS